jgi:X-Pro dipeptidyl-peptidase-like protein/hemolysin type calcium-binding protein
LRKAITAVIALAALSLAPAASAAVTPSVLGIPCSVQSSGVQLCSGSALQPVASWDGTPLAVDVALPPASVNGPFPTIFELHGWGFDRQTVETSEIERVAKLGYAVVRFDSRGWFESCGTPALRLLPACATSWIHLADARYEVRDTQHLAGLLADAGIAQSTKIGVTGASYGGGQSMLLATLKDRVMLPNGSFIPWTSPNGMHMRIAAAAPKIPWSDLGTALVPNGRQLDYLPDSPYGGTIGVMKQSYVTSLFTLGLPHYYAPPGMDPEADVINWFALLNVGEPYDPQQASDLIGKIQRYHSAYYLQDSLPAAQREAPAPLLIYNAWTDDIFPNDESLRYANKARGQFPGAEISLFYADAFGHPRANLLATTPDLEQRTDEFFARHLKGGPGSPLGIETFTQGCNGATAEGPFITQTWAEQHPGEVRFSEADAQSFDSTGGSAATAQTVDPGSGGLTSCRTTAASDDSNAANYRLPAATGSGYTLLGAPMVIAKLSVTGSFPQVAVRLWDVAPDNSQTLVTRSIYKPLDDPSAPQVFQLHGNGWRFAAGHIPKLEFLGRDSPYARASNGTFSIGVRDLELRLPVREQPDGGVVQQPLPPPGLSGTLHLAAAAACANPIRGTHGDDRLPGTSAADTIKGRAGADRINGRAGRDCLFGGSGDDRIGARDGERDVVRCGHGTDRARADRLDRVTGCETVVRR